MTTSGTTSASPAAAPSRAGATDTANTQNVAVVTPAPLAEPTPEPSKAKRLASVDALRGFDMFWIMGGAEMVLAFIALFVHPVPQAIARQFDHVEWEGFVAWDLIMPLFLFVSGVALPFSMSKWDAGKGLRRGFYLRLARRLILLWVLGIAVQGNLFAWDLDKLRLYSNTLQAIAAGYLVATIFLMTMSLRTQIIATAALLLGFWGIMMLAPIPGEGAGHLEPFKNYAHYFEGVVFGRFRDTWTYTWALSSLGFAATVMQGVFAGHVLRTRWTDHKKALALLALALGSLAAGWIWSFWFPIIKHIWTSSMVLWSGGWCYLLLVAFFWIIDGKGYRRWAFPLIVIGTNAIAVYVAFHLFDFRAMSDVFVGGLLERWPVLGEFLGASGAFLIPWLILYYMYKKRTFIRL